MKVLIAVGGTAGHLFPAQQLARLLSEDSSVVFAGHGLMRSPYFQRGCFPYYEVVSAPFGKRFPGAFLRGSWQASGMLLREKPDVVVGFGSYHTVPLLFASVCLRKRIVLYEANRSMGKVNRLFAPFAKRIAVQFMREELGKKEVSVPLFPWILQERMDAAMAKQAYGLEAERKTFLVFGGSQGAQFLNETMPHVALDGQVIHLAGNQEAAEATAKLYAKRGVTAVVKAFESEMHMAYSAADFAICRSGAGTIAELIRYGVPSLLIPYPYAYGHQEANADYVRALGGASILLQRDASPKAIAQAIESADWAAMRVALRCAEVHNQSLVGLDDVVRQCSNKCI